MNMKTIIVLILCLPLLATAGKRTYGDAIASRVVNVYDGDTMTVDIAGWPEVVGLGISVRCYGIDTPELRTRNEQEKKLGYAARDFVRELVKNSKKVELKNIRRDKYFRLLAEVYIDGVSLADTLIKSGHARKYDGGKKQKW